MWVEEIGGFRYTSCPKSSKGTWSNLLLFDGIAYAYLLSQDERLAEHLKKGASPGIDSINGFGKSLSMYIRVAPHHLNTLSAMARDDKVAR